ncbi:MAG: pyruvate, phosphate dikinase [Deltaproteobacteria bacterium]|nr:pyruvate, phosphate dikinase [Deltaproteobacteria bacterium]
MPSRALEINIECSRVDVTISERFEPLKEVMSKYRGIMDGLNTFLTEVCHPYRNWKFIVKEARGYSLDYFHLMADHPKGPVSAQLLIDIFLEALVSAPDVEVKADAVDNLLLFLQKIISSAEKEIGKFSTAVAYGFNRISSLDRDSFSLFVKSYYQLNRLIKNFADKSPQDDDIRQASLLLVKYLQESYECWLKEEDPFTWFIREVNHGAAYSEGLKEIFSPISHEQLKHYQDELGQALKDKSGDFVILQETLVHLPGYRQIADVYRELPRKLQDAGKKTGHGDYWKLIFLFHIMNNAGLSSIHEDTLREINRILSFLIGSLEPDEMKPLIDKTFDILRESVNKYPGTALNCMQNVGKAIYKTDESDLVAYFLDSVIDLGFQTPEMKGVSDRWQVMVNPAHIQNIRTWMEIIELNPKWSKKMISSLIIYLSLCGVYIKDTDLFPRDITLFLNSDIGNVYNLTKQLMRLFPVFFNDIGAEGQLRDISTSIDEISLRKDALIHFVRKQSHVESSNQIVSLMEATLEFWRTGKKELVEPYLPQVVYLEISTDGPYFEGVHRIIRKLFETKGIKEVQDLLRINDDEITRAVKGLLEYNPDDLERVRLAISFYRLLYRKYTLDFLEIDDYLKMLQPSEFPDIGELRTALAGPDTRNRLFSLLTYLERLKESILARERFDIQEDIYHKRHFTVDIPSMYGSYYEKKFDTLGLTFRLEALANTLFEELVAGINLELITRDTFFHIYDYLVLFNKALKLDGLLSSEIDKQLELLNNSLGIAGFSFTQFMDIFRGLSQAVSNIVNDFYNTIHQQNLIKIISALRPGELLAKYMPSGENIDKDKLIHRVSEVFLRERISSSLGLQQLDVFLGRVMNTLFKQADKLKKNKLDLLLNYDPQKAVVPILSENKNGSSLIHLGNKGLNLVNLSRYGFPVPPGFIVTTEVFRYREVIDNYSPAFKNLEDQLKREISTIELMTGKYFGDPKNPLLFSVRSGSPISLPGMMNTFLNVGINEKIVKGMISMTGQSWFPWDCYRRFMQSYGMAFGLNRDDFDDIIAGYKARLGIPHKIEFSGDQMKIIARSYRDFILDHGIKIEDTPFKQLYLTMSKVFDSWNTSKAKTYRKIMGISDDWGTAVTIQSMVYGNIGPYSGSGVVFTHSPRISEDIINLWGDYSLGNQGEDVVSGLVKTLPISNKQAEIENRETDRTLENSFPAIYKSIRNLAKELVYTRNWSPQEMEFTFEKENEWDLYFLQTRDMDIRERKTLLSFVTGPETGARLLGHGVGVSGGAMTGRAVFNLDEIRRWRREEPGTPLILIRGDTVPDDIEEIFESDGLLTARGGSTSHASIVAHRLGKTCVVGCGNLVCMEKESACSLDQVNLKAGDWLSIDGREGSIYSGKLEIQEVARRL